MGSTVSPAGVSGAGGPLGLGVSRMMAKEPVVEALLSLPLLGTMETHWVPPPPVW